MIEALSQLVTCRVFAYTQFINYPRFQELKNAEQGNFY